MKQQSATLKEDARVMSEQLTTLQNELNALHVTLPNLPHESVPIGKSAEDNQIVKEEGVIPELPENAIPHWDLATKYDIISWELGSKGNWCWFSFL